MTARAKMTDRQRYSEVVWRQGEPARERHREHLLETGTVVPRRITLALDLNELYGPEVDVACGGEEPMVDEWEAGTLAPTPDQVRALAELTGQTIEFFYEPCDVEMTNVFICDRSRRRKKA